MLRSLFERMQAHILVLLFLSAVTLALYWQALGNSFLIYWDDNGYVTGNMAIRGITWENVKIAFSRFYEGNYAPIQIISYMFDHAIWGMQPSGFILTNILIHTVNGILFYFLLTRLSWHRLPACLAALIFLVNPVQVESVVWISQRKNLLSLMFFLLSLYSYILYRDKSGKLWGAPYISSMAFFILALLTKSVAVILPLVLSVFDLCAPSKRDRKILILDKIPFFIAAFVVALVAMKSQSGEFAGGRTSYHGGTPYATLLTMLPVLIRYVGMTLWPMDLSAVYAPAIKTGIDFEVVQAMLLLILIAMIGVFLYYRSRDLLFWLLFFFLGLLPVSQIVPLVTLMNDRYLYFPLLGVSALIIGAAVLIVSNARRGKNLVLISFVAIYTVILGHYIIATHHRIPVWKNEYALWEDAVRKVPNSPKAHFQYAHILEYQREFDKAEEQYELGLNLSSSAFERYPLARLHEKTGNLDKAIDEYQRFLSRSPGFLDARNNLALIYIKKGRLDKAAEQYTLALQYKPNWAQGYNNLAIIYLKSGNKDKAMDNFMEAIKLNPADPEIHYNLGLVYLGKGMNEKAFQEFEIAANLNPGNPLFTKKFSEMSDKLSRKNKTRN